MRKIIMNIMATTGVSLLVLSLIAVCYKAHFLCIDTVFQTFFANILIHAGIRVLGHIDFKYPIAGSLLSISYMIIVVLVSGKIFHWYDSLPAGMLILLTIIVYLAGCWLSVIRIRREVDDINSLLQERKQISER